MKTYLHIKKETTKQNGIKKRDTEPQGYIKRTRECQLIKSKLYVVSYRLL